MQPNMQCRICEIVLTDEIQTKSAKKQKTRLCKFCAQTIATMNRRIAKSKCMKAYGDSECYICKRQGRINQLKDLCLDHHHGGGSQLRKSNEDKRGPGLYSFLARQNFPDKEKWAVLCAMHNQMKGALSLSDWTEETALLHPVLQSIKQENEN